MNAEVFEPMVVHMRVCGDPHINMSVDTENDMSMTLDCAVNMGGLVEHYTGATHVTPSDSTQTLHTEFLVVDSDITIDPIPSNYGLITWNGAVLTVS